MVRSILRGVFVFLVGLCLVIWSNQAGEILLKALGVFMILSAVIIVVYGLSTNSYMDLKGMSLISISSAVLFLIVGLLLLIKTGFFMEFIGLVLGILLVLYGLLQLYVSVRNSKGIQGRFWFFLVPALVLVGGIVFCFFPKYNIYVLCIVFGICLMLLGASEVWMSFKVRALAKRLRTAAQQEAEQMGQNQQTIVVEAIEPEGGAEKVEAEGSAESVEGAESADSAEEDEARREFTRSGE